MKNSKKLYVVTFIFIAATLISSAFIEFHAGNLGIAGQEE